MVIWPIIAVPMSNELSEDTCWSNEQETMSSPVSWRTVLSAKVIFALISWFEFSLRDSSYSLLMLSMGYLSIKSKLRVLYRVPLTQTYWSGAERSPT